MKKAVFVILITILSIAGSGFALDQVLAKQGGIGYISSAIEAMKIRAAKPGMPPDEIARQAAKANKGAVGLMKTLADGAQNGLAGKSTEVLNADATPKATEPNEVFIRVSENHDAMLNAQMGTAAVGDIKGASENLNGAQQVAVRGTDDGREVIGVIHDSSVEDLGAVDRINAMNIPENIREKILENYYKTGSLPEIVVKEKRKPTTKASGDLDDPYNTANY